jgi:GT2 family glycosyltransferase
MTKPKVSYLVICYNRKDDVRACVRSILAQRYPDIEVIVVDNASIDGTDEMFREEFSEEQVQYFKMSENLGVSGGRNAALERATGQVLVTIDDDAVLVDENTTELLVDRFDAEEDLGAVAFRIEDFDTGEIQRMFFPSKDKSRDPDKEFETTWFIGAGHAIPRKVYDEIGLYRDYRPYGSEEFDLGLRVIDHGYRIVYDPCMRVRHKETKTARLPPTRLFALRLKHRIKAAVLNLPWTSVLTFLIIRSGTTLVKSRGNVVALGIAYWWIIESLPSWLRERQPIGKPAIARLKALKGPLYH